MNANTSRRELWHDFTIAESSGLEALEDLFDLCIETASDHPEFLSVLSSVLMDKLEEAIDLCKHLIANEYDAMLSKI